MRVGQKVLSLTYLNIREMLRHTPCLENDTDVAHYNFNPHQQISVICGTDVAERIQISNDDLLSHFS